MREFEAAVYGVLALVLGLVSLSATLPILGGASDVLAGGSYYCLAIPGWLFTGFYAIAFSQTLRACRRSGKMRPEDHR